MAKEGPEQRAGTRAAPGLTFFVRLQQHNCSGQIRPGPFGGHGNGLPEAARLGTEGVKTQLGSPLLEPEMIRKARRSRQTLPMWALEWHF